MVLLNAINTQGLKDSLMSHTSHGLASAGDRVFNLGNSDTDRHRTVLAKCWSSLHSSCMFMSSQARACSPPCSYLLEQLVACGSQKQTGASTLCVVYVLLHPVALPPHLRFCKHMWVGFSDSSQGQPKELSCWPWSSWPCMVRGLALRSIDTCSCCTEKKDCFIWLSLFLELLPPVLKLTGLYLKHVKTC